MNDAGTASDFEAHINQLERDRLLHEQALALKRQETRTQRWRTLATASIAFAAAATVVGALFILWLAMRGPSATEQILERDRLACVEHGGTWTYVNGTDDMSSCTMPDASTR